MAEMYLKNGMKLIHKKTRKQITFLKWIDDATANCASADAGFVKLSRQEIEEHYETNASMTKAYREKRKGQMW